MEEVFNQGESFLHKADPRLKIITALFLACIIANLNTFPAAVFALMVGSFFLLLSRLPVKEVIKRLFFVNTFVAFLWLFLPFSVPGRPLFSLWKWSASMEGIGMASLITLRCNSILLIIISFIETTSLPVLALSLTELKVPAKLTLIMLISYRYINVIFEEYHRLLEAAKIRGFVPGNNLHTYKTYAYMVAMVLIRSYERGVRVHQAMQLRGFNGKFYSLHRFDLKTSDIYLAGGTFLCGVLLIFLEYFY